MVTLLVSLGHTRTPSPNNNNNTRLTAHMSGTTQVSRYQKGKTNLDLLEQEIVSVSGICWAICKSASCPRDITLNSQTTPNSTFCIAYHMFVVGEHGDLKFGMQVDHSKSQPADDKLSLKGA